MLSSRDSSKGKRLEPLSGAAVAIILPTRSLGSARGSLSLCERIQSAGTTYKSKYNWYGLGQIQFQLHTPVYITKALVTARQTTVVAEAEASKREYPIGAIYLE